MVDNANEIFFRCSSLGKIMGEGNVLTEPQKKKLFELQTKIKLTENQSEELAKLLKKRDNPELPDTCKTHLVDVFVASKYGRREEIKSKYIDKGNAREEDAITLLSRSVGVFLTKNSERLFNDYIQGEPDLFIGEDIRKAEVTIDTKVSWSAHTFFRAKNKDLNPEYYWQGNGYMNLTGAKKHIVAHCLINGTDKIITDEKKRLYYQLEITSELSHNYEEYIEKCKQIEINHIFDLDSFLKEYPYFEFHNDVTKWEWDIPMKERLCVFEFHRDESEMNKISARVEECRKYMNENLFKIAEKNLPRLSNNI